MAFVERLQQIRRTFETGDTPAEIVDVLNANVQRLLDENVAEKALTVGQQAPSLDVHVISDHGTVPLSYFMVEKYLVLTWFRGDW